MSENQRDRDGIVAVGVFLLLGIVLVAGYLADPGGLVATHLAQDQTWFEWLLSHGAYSVRHLTNPLFSTRQNMPDGVNMMANTSVLGVTIPLAPLTLLLGPKITYLIWIAGACAGTATTTYLVLARHLVRSRGAAFLGGVHAGFAPGVVHHANGQPNFVANFLLPLIVVRALRLGAGGRWRRDGVVLALLVVWQLFINEELLLITAVAVAVAVLVYAGQRPRHARERARSFGAALAVTAATVAVLGAYPMWMQFLGPQSYRALPMFHSWGEDLAAFVTLPRDALGGVATAEMTLGGTEQNTWFGWPLTVVLLLVAVLLWRDLVARTATLVGVLFAVAALGPEIKINGGSTGLPGLWSLLPARTPVLALMMPSRLSFAVIGAVVVLMALAWDALVRRCAATGTRRADLGRLGQIAVVAALIPLIPVPLATRPDERPPVFITSGAWRSYVPAGASLVPVPLPDESAGRTTLSWSAAAEQEFSVPCGYFLGPDQNGDARLTPATGNVTAELFRSVIWTGRRPVVTAATRAAVRADLARWKASVVVLGPHPAERELRTVVEQLLGPGERHQDVWLWDVRAVTRG